MLGSSTSGYLTIYPGGARPNITSLTYTAGATAFNQVTAKLSAAGTLTIWNAGGTADLLVDVMGSYGPQAAYTYNGDGLRATRTTTTATQAFAWDATSSLPLLLNDGATSYLYDNTGNPIEQIDSSGTALYYQHDQYGSTRLLTNAAGAIAAAYTYTAHGVLSAHSGSADTPLRWNGQYQDIDTGLYYLRARYYDPVTTQFLTRDPLEKATQSAYNYSGNNALSYSDPSGLISIGQCGTVQIGFFIGLSYSFCLVAAYNETNGDISLGRTGTLGALGDIYQSPTIGLSLGGQLTNARTVDQLGGPFGYGGGSAATPLYGAPAGVTVFGGTSKGAPNGQVLGTDISLGVPIPFVPPAEIHVGLSCTEAKTDAKFNLGNVLKEWG